MSLKSDQWMKPCLGCRHSQYVHFGVGHTGPCIAFKCKHGPIKCTAFIGKDPRAVELGGMSSEKKAAAARENGKRGGRPRICGYLECKNKVQPGYLFCTTHNL